MRLTPHPNLFHHYPHLPQVRLTVLGVLSELLVWGSILLLVVFLFLTVIGFIGRFIPNENQKITLYFRDASQLSMGAPVHYMGVDVGYVDKVVPLEDMVEVQVKMNHPDFRLPDGSTFTIQFNGLAGAKTLEVFPPAVDVTTVENHFRNFETFDPIRIRDVFKTQQSVSEAFQLIYENTRHTLGRFETADALLAHTEAVNQGQANSIERIQNFQSELAHATPDIDRALRDSTQNLNELNQLAVEKQPYTTPTYINQHVRPGLIAFSSMLTTVNDGIKDLIEASFTDTVHQNLQQFNAQTSTIHQSVEDTAQWITTTHNRLTRIDQKLQRANEQFNPKPGLSPSAERTQRWSKKTQTWVDRAEADELKHPKKYSKHNDDN